MRPIFPILIAAVSMLSMTGRATANVSLTLEAAEAAVEAGDFETALSELQDALLKDPTEPYLLYNYGLTAYLAGDMQIARDAWQRLKDLEGEDREIGRNLGALSLFQLGNADMREATAFDEARNKEDALLLYRRAMDFYRIAEAMEGEASRKAKSNVRVAENAVVEMSTEIGVGKLDRAEKMLEDPDLKQRVKDGHWRHFDHIESQIGEGQNYTDQALALRESNKKAQEARAKADELLENALLLEAQAMRAHTEKRDRQDNFRNAEQKTKAYENVLEKYDEVLAQNPENKTAEKEREEVASEIGDELLAEAVEERAKAKEEYEKDRLRKTMNHLEKAQELLEQADYINPDDPEIEANLEQNTEMLAEFKEERGDDLVANAERQNNPEHEVRNLEEAREEYEDAAALDPDRAEAIEEKLDALNEELAEAYEDSGDAFTEKAMAMAESAQEATPEPEIDPYAMQDPAAAEAAAAEAAAAEAAA
ncbi:MAG: hypothetical protein ACOCVG_05615, partial [Verrucomicrobiota bacterium]